MPEPLEEVGPAIKTVKVYTGNFLSAVYTRDEWNEEVRRANPGRAMIQRDIEALIAALPDKHAEVVGEMK